MAEAPEKNLALDIVRITEAAALASARWLGRGAKEDGDGAAVDAMRNSFSTLHVDGIVVIGEGEKDNAPMLYNGEHVGIGDGPQLDVAVDPVEGTSLLAFGRPNAISTVAVAPRGSMFNPGPSFYMQKLVVPGEARNVVDLDAPVAVNLANVAKALGKKVQDLVVFVLDKPRHKQLIADIRAVGARIQLHTDGDVAGALMAVDPRNEVDIMMGTGGTPEGVLAACAIKGMDGQMLARLDPQSYVEKEAITNAGIDLREVLTVNDLVKSDDCFFAATGISGGDFLRGVRYSARHAVTHSLVLRGKTGTIRYVESFHDLERLNQLGHGRLGAGIPVGQLQGDLLAGGFAAGFLAGCGAARGIRRGGGRSGAAVAADQHRAGQRPCRLLQKVRRFSHAHDLVARGERRRQAAALGILH